MKTNYQQLSEKLSKFLDQVFNERCVSWSQEMNYVTKKLNKELKQVKRRKLNSTLINELEERIHYLEKQKNLELSLYDRFDKIYKKV